MTTLVEKYCGGCFETLKIDQFRSHVSQGRLRYEYVCHDCEIRQGRMRYRQSKGLPISGVLVRQSAAIEFSPGTTRTCIGCALNLPIAAFLRIEHRNEQSAHKRCNECRSLQRLGNERSLRRSGGISTRTIGVCKVGHGEFPPGERCGECKRLGNAARYGPDDSGESKATIKYKCRVADCDISVIRKGMACFAHSKLLTNTQQIAKDSEKLRAIQVKRMESYGPSDKRCKKCKKPMNTSGTCYECSTGKKKTIVSIYERQLAQAAVA